MTVEAGGWLDPALGEKAGITVLDWRYGLSHPDAKGPDYWHDACGAKARSFPKSKSTIITAGMAIDEWVPPTTPETLKWLCKGLRAGRRENPDVFIAVWLTDPTPELIELGHDGTVDLFIIEGYTHSDPAMGPGLVTGWQNALRRCDGLAKAGLEDKMIFSFGHIDSAARRLGDPKGERLGAAWIRERIVELKQKYPRMPGVAFFESEAPDSPELRELVRACDALSAEFWP